MRPHFGYTRAWILCGSLDPLRIVSEDRRLAGIQRTVRLVHDLQKGVAHTRYTAAKLLSIKPAGAARQLEAIQQVLPNVVFDDNSGIRTYRISRTGSSALLQDAEVVTACLGASLEGLFDGSSYAQGMRQARNRVGTLARHESRFDDADRKFWFVPRGGEIALPTRSHHLDEIVDGLLQLNELEVSYQRFSGTLEDLIVQPLSLAIYDHQLYLIARLPGSPTVHPYRFSRIKSVEARETTFVYPSRAEYDPDVIFRDSFGIHVNPDDLIADVVVHLDKRWATYAKAHRWHESQQVFDRGDAVEVRMRVRLCPEFKAWIRSFGADASVVKPQTLRDEIEASRGERARKPKR